MISRNILGFSVTPNMMRVMECNGFYASIMKADKKKKDEYGLPLGMPIPCLPVDYLKERPDFWIGGYGSYVCAVDSDWGLWFNFQHNNYKNSSVVVSVKGMNPLTGQRIEGLGLQQYKECCPAHKTKFKHKRLCEKCGFEWPEQNYISDPSPFFLDGFRTSDGKVRQFYFTEDMAKSIPELVIGKDDTVPAFGFCFYNLKDMKNNYENGNRLKNKKAEEHFRKDIQTLASYGTYSVDSGTTYHGYSGYSGCLNLKRKRSKYGGSASAGGPITAMYSKCCEISDFTIGSSADFSSAPIAMAASPFEVKTSGIIIPESKKRISRSFKSAEVGIGAGEEIDQTFSGDRRSVDVWQDKPASIFRIYFVFQEEFERYVKAGLNVLKSEKEGILAGCPVGGSNE